MMAIVQKRTAIERALGPAKSDEFETIAAVKAAPSRERYFTDQIAVPVLLKQLRDAMNLEQPENRE